MWYQTQASFSAFSKEFSDLADNDFANQTDMLERCSRTSQGVWKIMIDWSQQQFLKCLLYLTLRTWSVWFGVFPQRRQTGFNFVLISLFIMCYTKRLTPGPSCAGLTDKEPVQGWMCHTSNFLRGLHSKWMRKPESPFPSTRTHWEALQQTLALPTKD